MPEVIIPGPEGRIEGRYHVSDSPTAPLAVVLHPHPVYGGTMNNKVVYHLYHAFVRNGFSVLRFNFRGVGRSQGKFDDGIGELADAATALDWMQQQNPDAPSCWIAGFSFGAWISLQLLMRRPELEGFVIASPPANLYDFSFLSPCPSAGLVTQGSKDDVVAEDSVAKLVEKLREQKGTTVDYQVLEGADHYYRNHMDELTTLVNGYIADRINNATDDRRARPDRKRRQIPRS